MFLPDYNVSLAEMIIPAADLSEQISTAGMEASGTGNMKLALNGALTIGTLDGANIEIRDHVGAENIFIFGMEAMEVDGAPQAGAGCDRRDPRRRGCRARSMPSPRRILARRPGRFDLIAHALRHPDHYMVSADFDSYYGAQRGIDARWQVVPAWTRSHPQRGADATVSSDRTIREYAGELLERAGARRLATGRRCAGRAARSDALGPKNHYLRRR